MPCIHNAKEHSKRLLVFMLVLSICAACLTLPVYSSNQQGTLAKAARLDRPKPVGRPFVEKSATNNSGLISSAPAQSNKPDQVRVSEAYGKLPLRFEFNAGQTDSRIKFLSRGNGYGLYLSGTEATFLLRKARHAVPNAGGTDSKLTSVMRMELVGANPDAEVEGLDRLGGVSNYFIGNDPTQWRTNIPNYGRVRVRDVYPGIDIIYYGKGRQLEYDLVVAPGASPNDIRLDFKGVSKLRINSRGDVVIKSSGGEVLMHRPAIYQESNGEKKIIRGRFVKTSRKQLGFRVEGYDRSKPLVIDPALTLAYSTFLGGSDQEIGNAIAVDSDGSAYVTGRTYSTDFPTQNALQPTLSGGGGAGFPFDAFVSKLSADGSSLIYSTYLGGSNDSEEGHSIAVDDAGNAYLMGLTKSDNFPTTANALQTIGQSNVLQNFVSKLDASGTSLLYSTYLSTSSGGVNGVMVGGIAADAFGHAYVTGTTLSASFPIKNAFQTSLVGGSQAAFITKLDTTASGVDSLVYSSYLGGSISSYGYSIAVDATGNAYVAGLTFSPNFPTKNAFQPTISSGGGGFQLEAFATKINTNASGSDSLLYSTYLGGGAVETEAYIVADEVGNAYVGGETFSTNFPTKNPYQSANLGSADAFVTKLDTQASGAASLVYSTYLGGNNTDSAKGIAVDSSGDVYLAGTTISTNFPQVNPLPIPTDQFDRSFVAKLNNDASDLIYSTYFSSDIYGIALDSAQNVYVTGVTDGANFPTTPGVFQSQFGGNADAFISKLSFNEATGLTISSITPNRGGDTGFVTATIKGTGFAVGATVTLTMAGQTDIVGNPVTVRADGRAITVRFDLHGSAQGTWDVSVMNPGGPTVILAQGFTVEAGSSPNVWVDLVGRTAIRSGQEEGFVIFYGNTGNTDAEGVPITISGIPKNATVRLDFDLNPTPLPAEYEQYRSDDISPIIETETEKVIPLFVGIIPAGGTRSFRIFLKAEGQSLTEFTLNVDAGDPFFGSPIRAKPEDCYKKVAIQIIKELFSRLIKKYFPLADVAECIDLEAQALIKISQEIVDAASHAGTGGLNPADALASTAKMLAPALKAGIKCAEVATGVVIPQSKIVTFVLETLPKVYTYYKIIDTCSDAFFSRTLGGIGARLKFLIVRFVGSLDPNDKIGARGSGPEQYLAGDQPLRYTILFENVPTASAPAQTVVINDQLDPAKFDFSTFSLGPLGFDTRVVTPPAGVSEFSADVDLRPGNDLIARIDASLDEMTGLITWRFQSIDPATGLPTTDPLAGFLPPNQTPPEGDGFVTFNVMPKVALVTGDVIPNQATIIFDNNAPIDTPVWSNTLDKTKPVSGVMPLAAQQAATNFTVEWSGTDPDSGIEGFNIYVSENGGPYTVWLRNATGNSATFVGQPFKTYGFYSIAQDNAENQEDAKTIAEATTATPPSASQFSASSYDVLENAGSATITVTRMGDTGNAATVDYATGDGTAISGLDYTGVSGTLDFAAGQTSQTFNVPIINNTIVDGERTLYLTLTNATGGDVISSPETATLNILDDDRFGDTPTGSPVVVHLGNITITFTQVSTNGSSAAEPIDPNSQGSPPSGYAIIGPAYDISTNVEYSGSVQVCFELDGINDPGTFAHLKVLHTENGVLVDRTTGQSFSTRMLCGNVDSLSPFVIAQGETPTAAPASISGEITTGDGAPLGGVTLELSGTTEIRSAITNSNGQYSFENVETGGFYTVVPSRANYTFSPVNRSFSLVGNNTDAVFTARPDAIPTANPLDSAGFFVRQQYLDFLSREPDQSGWDFWTNEITSCGANQQCIEAKRINVSAAYFLSIEFQQTGYLVYRMYKAAYGNLPNAPVSVRLREFLPDSHEIGQGVVVGQTGWETVLKNNKQAFAAEFVQRSRFTEAFPTSMAAAQFVDSLSANAGNPLSQSERDQLVNDLTTGARTRAQVLHAVAENQNLYNRELNRAFVLMQYFGYLRRDPNVGPDTTFDGYNFWLNKLNSFNGNFVNAEMVKAFTTSAEYQLRFSPVMTHTNAGRAQ